jgi:hypothetical protein
VNCGEKEGAYVGVVGMVRMVGLVSSKFIVRQRTKVFLHILQGKEKEVKSMNGRSMTPKKVRMSA